MNIAGSWYTSDTFWAAAGFVGVVVFGALTVVVTYLVGSTHRELTYLVVSNAPLLGRITHASRLRVIYGNYHVPNPRIVTIRLTARGRKDICSSDFSQDKPLTFDLGRPVINVFVSDDTAQEVTTAHANTVEFGPTLIRKGQNFWFTILVDGIVRNVTCYNPLVDIEVKGRNESDERRIRFVMTAAFSSTFLAGIVPSIALVLLLKSNQKVSAALTVTIFILLIIVEAATGYILGRITGYVAGRIKESMQ